MKKIFCLIVFVCCSAGCTQLRFLPYLDQALLLKSFGAEKQAQHNIVDKTTVRFDAMLADIQSGKINERTTESQMVKFYGPPILSVEEALDGNQVRKSVYRYAIFTKGPHKVYVYYDMKGKVIKWEKVS